MDPFNIGGPKLFKLLGVNDTSMKPPTSLKNIITINYTFFP